MSRVMRKIRVLCVGWAALFYAEAFTLSASADELPPAPTPLALKLMLRTIAFDQHLPQRGGGDFVVVVLSEPGQDAMRAEAMAAAEELNTFKILKRALRFVPVELRTGAGLREDVKRLKASALLVLPGLSEMGQESVSQVAGEAQLYTMSLAPTLVQRAVLVGVYEYQGRPKIALNRAMMRALDIDFEKTLLHVVEIFPGSGPLPGG